MIEGDAMEPITGLEESLKRRSLGILLDSGLRVSSEDRVLIIHDESLAPYCADLMHELIVRDVSAVLINIPKAYQHYLVSKIITQPDVQWLPVGLMASLNQSSAVLNVLDGDLATSRLRKAVIEQPRTPNCRLAHIPGLSDEILAITLMTDFARILDESELVAWVLGNGGETELLTYDDRGAEYRLMLDLGGWENEPLMSPGTLLPGSWGNFPPGETFCCPTPSTINGTVCIGGSVPGLVLKNDEAVVLDFEEGRLTRWRPLTRSPAIAFFEKQKAVAQGRHDANWNVFAELGIGLNPIIHNLTGNSLFDEKVAGTVHVAVGDNTTFGFYNKALMHADLVAWRPTLRVGGTTIMNRGVLQMSEMTQQRASWLPGPLAISGEKRIRINESEVKTEDGVLKRRLCKGGRIGLVQMGDRPLGAALDELNRMLSQGEPLQLEHILKSTPDIGGFTTDRLIAVLQHYNCIR
jgi:hypothetical protein